VVRVLSACALSWALFRVIDLVRARTPLPLLQRLVHAMSFIDTRQLSWREPRLEAAALRRLGFYALMAAGALPGIVAASELPQPALAGLRWLASAVFVYSFAEVVFALLRLFYGAAGAELPPTHRRPVASRSVAEFWSTRWNQVIAHWMRCNVFLPVARRAGVAAGVAASFLVSAIWHAQAILLAVGWQMAAAMTAFFVLQLVLISVERSLAVWRWPRAVQHVWFFAAVGLSSPLFTEPILQVFQLGAIVR
jgi:hypothetical protein